jgi:tRNA-dihydrouridine synthase A
VPDPATQIERMIDYAERELAAGEVLSNITRHMLGLLSHTPGAREFRRVLSEGARDRAAGVAPLKRALDLARAA